MGPILRDIYTRTVAGVLAPGIIWVLIVWLWPRIQPWLASSGFAMSGREAVAWGLVGTLLVLLAFFGRYAWRLRPPKEPPAAALTLHSGTKPTLTLTHTGAPATYRVDGRLVELLDGSANPLPTLFRCELLVGGIKSEYSATLKDGEWLNIILAHLEPQTIAGPVGPIANGHHLVVRRGTFKTFVTVPDVGAVVELKIQSTPKTPEHGKAHLYRVVRQGATIDLDELAGPV